MFTLKRKYHYVPSCPKCGSKKTGHYVYLTGIGDKTEKIIANYLRNGELVQVSSSFDSNYENAFCTNCGCEWHADIITTHLTDKQISEQKFDRGITKKNIEKITNIKKITKQKLKEERKNRKKKKKEEKLKMK